MVGKERFTQRARRVLHIAEEEAQRMGCASVGSEHILLGLVAEEGGVAGRALRKLDVNLDEVRQVIVSLIPSTERGKKVNNISRGASAEDLLNLSVEQAKLKGHHYIGTEHILLALSEQKKSRASNALRQIGLKPDDIRDKVNHVLEESSSPPDKISVSPSTNLFTFVQQSLDQLSKADRSDVQTIAASQIQLLSAYYNLVLEQAKRSFTWALIAAALGLIFFIAAVSFVIYQQSQSAAVISLVSGALIEFISGINFYLYGKTSAQLTGFQARLDTTQRYLLANSMCEGLDGDIKQNTRADLIRAVAGIVVDKTPNS